ncbi:hypothetical protein BJ742DRAFT_776481 [Cladochytrium replicatum]|nr:hypothetical protein BJ742DRAFT_776481 [Cladochytrium replicatum]
MSLEPLILKTANAVEITVHDPSDPSDPCSARGNSSICLSAFVQYAKNSRIVVRPLNQPLSPKESTASILKSASRRFRDLLYDIYAPDDLFSWLPKSDAPIIHQQQEHQQGQKSTQIQQLQSGQEAQDAKDPKLRNRKVEFAPPAIAEHPFGPPPITTERPKQSALKTLIYRIFPPSRKKVDVEHPPQADRKQSIIPVEFRGADPGVYEDYLNQNDPVYSSAYHACDRESGRSPKAFLDLIAHPNALHKRGAHGETVLHKLILRFMVDKPSREVYRKMIELLLDDERHRRAFVNSVFEGPEYRGESPAHMAVAARDLKLLQFLVSKGADVNIPRCGGHFFSIESVPYNGGTVLGMAIRNNQKEQATYLLRDCGAEPNAWDQHGNTALHVLAWWGIASWNTLSEFENSDDNESGENEQTKTKDGLGPWELLRAFGAKDTQRNSMSYTPFLTAVFRRNKSMVEALIDDSREILWEFGEVKKFNYPLTDIDVNPHKDKNSSRTGSIKNELRRISVMPEDVKVPRLKRMYPTAIEIAVKNEDGNLLMQIPIFQIVLRAKWRMYTRYMFYWYFGIACFYQILLIIAVWMIPNGPIEIPAINGSSKTKELAAARWMYFSVGEEVSNEAIIDTITRWGVLRFVLEIILLTSNILSLFNELFQEMMKQGIRGYFFDGFNSSHNTLQLLNILLFFSALLARLARDPLAENTILSVLAISGWTSLLYFGKGLKTIGPTIIMVYRMLITDVLKKFAIIYGIFLIAFGQAIWLQMSLLAVDSTFVVQTTPAAESGINSTMTTSGGSSDSTDSVSDYANAQTAILKMFGLIVNGSEFSTLQKAPLGALAVILFVVYMVLSSILVLNVLIAMLNSTYTKITDQSEEVWFVQWANLILEMDEKRSKRRPTSLRLGFNAKQKSNTRYFQLELKEGTPIPIRLRTSDQPGTCMGDLILRDIKKRSGVSKAQLNDPVIRTETRREEIVESRFWWVMKSGKLKVP